jgi:hypothetical protein
VKLRLESSRLEQLSFTELLRDFECNVTDFSTNATEYLVM